MSWRHLKVTHESIHYPIDNFSHRFLVKIKRPCFFIITRDVREKIFCISCNKHKFLPCYYFEKYMSKNVIRVMIINGAQLEMTSRYTSKNPIKINNEIQSTQNLFPYHLRIKIDCHISWEHCICQIFSLEYENKDHFFFRCALSLQQDNGTVLLHC